ncbi:unnamed protein product [Rotaria sordida]|uniref:AB hydrolase-1 domain-containing protein n=2 Tax=Rotaria sordida TaxID=392033 RepID=A0A813VEF9_9BILA|nr:unnamed protein product [Rotaria sordida]CAF3624593.1 unnamed protein product [Rotaria sordida]
MLKNQFVLFWECVFGPKLYQTYPLVPPSPTRQPTHLYIKNTTETLSDIVFLVFKILLGIFQTICPLCILYFYYKGSLTYENGILLLRLSSCMIIIPIYFMLLRGISRFINPTYKTFINEFSQVKCNSTQKTRQKLLAKYDFSLSHWKPDYIIQSSTIRKLPMISTSEKNLINQTEVTFIERLFHYPSLLVGYICVNVFGRRLMFPGSLQIIRHMTNRALLDGRTNLIVSHRAKRYILRTSDGNHIDTIFVDRRIIDNRQTLIITCEGNAGFYEIGCMMTPIEAGYSVLGWNRPGFGESSGYPGTLSEINSIDAVMRYAIEELHFSVNNIVVFAWSIGGYSACWTAVHYQDIRGLILDAVFDDVLPLAQRQMPSFASKFVEKAIRYYLDLNNIQLLKLYNGPFYLIRRTYDEIMNFIPGKLATNRANEILFSILPYRYPFIYHNDETFTLLKQYVCSKKVHKQRLFHKYCSDIDDIQIQIERYQLENPIGSYPCKFGKNLSFNERQRFAIYLVDQYLIDFDSQHCTSLPQSYFYLPNRCV